MCGGGAVPKGGTSEKKTTQTNILVRKCRKALFKMGREPNEACHGGVPSTEWNVNTLVLLEAFKDERKHRD